MKISLVIPCYTINPELERLALWCLASYKDQVDELIVVEDGGMFSPKLLEMADIYIYNRENKGFTANVNSGWRQATGDFVMIVSSDTELRKGNLTDLCIEGKVTSPHVQNQTIERLAGPFFCVPKSITQERGMLREEMRTYCSDSEYDERVKDIFVKVPSVEIFHEMMQTVSAAGVEGGEEQRRDRDIYQKLIEEGKVKTYDTSS